MENITLKKTKRNNLKIEKNDMAEKAIHFMEKIIQKKTKYLMSTTRRKLIKEGKIQPTLHTEEHKTWLKEKYTGENNPQAKEYYVISPDNQIILIKCLSSWCKKMGFSKHTFWKLLKNSSRTPNRGPAKGWKITSAGKQY